MKSKIVFVFIFLATLARAQVDTNIVIISGAGNTNDNTAYYWDGVGYTASSGIRITPLSTNKWALDGGYFSSNFPAVWYDVGYLGWPPPDPTGAFYTNTVAMPPTLWSVAMTNYWTVPGDAVSYQAEGRNMATTNAMTGIEILIDTNIIYQSALSAGNGAPFTLDGRMKWDGTNINYYAEMTSGAPSNQQPATFGQLVGYPVGTNSFSIVPTGNTNGFILLAASVQTTRAPQGAIAPATSVQTGPGSTSFVSSGSVTAGMIWPSNSWSIATITNTVPNFAYGTFSSNGQALVTVQVTNGVVRIVQALY